MKPYQVEYSDFIKSYQKGATDAEDTGQLIARLAQYFYQANELVGINSRKMVTVAAQVTSGTDEFSGKPIAVNKAEIIIAATPEAMELNDAKIDKESIEQLINALKALQKGQTNDFHYTGNT